MLIILSPVYNDWESYQQLLLECRTVLQSEPGEVRYIAVDDCSSETSGRPSLSVPNDLQIIELARNVGHQKSIVIGLAYISENYPLADVVVMDSDGEDMPQHVLSLLQEGRSTGRIVFARRSQRSEGFIFKTFYKAYKQIFFGLTGQIVDFGNFSFIPHAYLRKVVSLSEVWNHYAVGILKTKLPFSKISLQRGKRYAGKSKMNFNNLVIHGLSAISVYSDVVATRLLLFSVFSIMICLFFILFIVGLRVFTELAIPGWATNMILGLVIIIFQAFFMAMFMAFSILSSRSQITFLPIKDYHTFIIKIIG